MTATRAHLAVAGLIGAAGLAVSAYGSHAGGTGVLAAGLILLAHAPAVIGVSLARKAGHLAPLLAQLAVAALALGPALFALAVTVRAVPAALGVPLAPFGASLAMLGWLGVSAAAVFGGARRTSPGSGG